jgi:hypothetical protein
MYENARNEAVIDRVLIVARLPECFAEHMIYKCIVDCGDGYARLEVGK